MYLVYKPPQMLPTQTLNPVVTVTGVSKRSQMEETGSPFGTLAKRSEPIGPSVGADQLWWFGVFVTSLGGFLFVFS